MLRPASSTVALLVILAACGKDANQKAMDSAAKAAAAPPPVATPRVMGFDFGHAADSMGRVSGGAINRFAPADTIVVSARTQMVTSGNVSARLMMNGKTVDSIGAPAASPDTAGMAYTTLRFVPGAKPRAAGAYTIEIFLGGQSQGMKEITIAPAQ